MSEQPPPGTWMAAEADPRENGVVPRGEEDVVLDYLRRYRITLELKCSGLDAEQLARRAVPPSTMSLLGLVRHMARVEHRWFRAILQEQDLTRLYWTEQDHDLDFNGAVADPEVVEDAWETWRSEVAYAESYAASLDDWGRTVPFRGDDIEVRDVLVHMVEEYARHCGHADLLRECIDGRTGH
jgi:uncharacterized damage-inducible protein DinB